MKNKTTANRQLPTANQPSRVTHQALLVAFCFLLTAYCLLPTAAFAQCPNVTLTLTPAPSTCMSNGTIRVAVSGGDAGNLRMTDAQYNITPVAPSSYSQPWATAAGGTLTGVPPGTYTAGLQAFCTTSNVWVTYSTTATVVVAASYTVPATFVQDVRKTLSCVHSGRIRIRAQDGRVPFTITMTDFPPAYTGPTTGTITTQTGTPRSGTHTFDDLPAGAYTFTITDNCAYNTTVAATVTTASADFTQNYANANLSAPSTIVLNDCHTVRVVTRTSTSGQDSYDHYFDDVARAKYYQFAINEDNTTPPTTGWAPHPAGNSLTYTLSTDYNTFKTQNRHVAVWIKVGNCAPALLRTMTIANNHGGAIYTPFAFSNQTCNDFTLSHYTLSGSDVVYCFPYEWRIVMQSGATLTNLSNWTSVATADAQLAHNVPYGTRVEYRDASGQTWFRNITITSPVDNLSIGQQSNTCFHLSLPLPAGAGTLSTEIHISHANGDFPHQTLIEFISGPATPTLHSSYTITTGAARFYPFNLAPQPLSALNGAPPATPYQVNQPGTYSFRVTIPTCPPATFSISPSFSTVLTPISYTDVEDCNGLTVFPTGQLGTVTVQGTTSSVAPWFAMHSAPAGVDRSRVVRAGEPLSFPVSGEYVLKMMFGSSTISCAASSLSINYTKRQLSLDAAVTTAYACPGGGTQGFIRVQGTNGSGSYTYQLLSSGGATITSNNAGTFSHGSAGETYTVRVIDTGCGTSFDQTINILNLNAAAIASSSSPEYCGGSTIQLHCMNLGNTTYNWSGPDNWSSTQQNPMLPNATPLMSGTYTVSVVPENCTLPITDSVSITVNPTVIPSVTITAVPVD